MLSGPEMKSSTVCLTYEDQPKDIHWALGHPENTGSTSGSGDTKHYSPLVHQKRQAKKNKTRKKKKKEKKKEKRHLLSLHNKQKNTKLLVGSHFALLPILNLCLTKGWVVRIRVITL